MQACLHNQSLSSKKLQCLITHYGNNSNILHRHRHRNRSRQFAFPSCSPSDVAGLGARPCQRLDQPLMQMQHVPSPLHGGSNVENVDSSKHKKAGGGHVPARPSAKAVVVLACTLGALCSGWKAGRAHAAPWSLRFPPNAASDHDSAAPSSPMKDHGIHEKSIEMLWDIFQRKAELGVRKPAYTPMVLLESLRELVDRRELSKDYHNRLRTSEKGDAATNSLYSEWARKDHSPEAYEIGLLLIDLLINQGDYERADIVCQQIESYAPQSDIRPQIRRVVINMILIADAVGSEVKDTDKSRELKKKMDATVLMLIKLFKENDDDMPNLRSAPHL